MSKTAFANDILYIKNLKNTMRKMLKFIMNSIKLHDTKLIYRNLFFLNTVKKNYQGN